MTPAERLAAKKKGGDVKPPWGQRRLAHRIVVFPDNKLRSLREELGLTQRDVADNAEITPSLFANAEAGFGLNLSTALKLAAFFGKSVEEIWGTQKKHTLKNKEKIPPPLAT